MSIDTLLKFSLVLLLLLILWGLSYWFAHYRSAHFLKSNLYLEKLESLLIAPGSSLQLVKIGAEKLVLLSVSAGRTDMIMSLDVKDLKPLDNKTLTDDLQKQGLKTTGEAT